MGVSSSVAITPPLWVELAAHPLRWQLMRELAGGDLRVRELSQRVAQPQNLVSYHLRRLRSGGLVSAGRSSFDGRDTYYRLELDGCARALADAGGSLHPGLAFDASPSSALSTACRRPAVLFLCTGNSARSPMAEALLRHRTGGRVDVASAGSNPRRHLHPGAVRVLHDDYGIDISGQRPRLLDELAPRRFDTVITLCDKVREMCPEFPGRESIHWSTPDPADEADGDAAFRHTAGALDARIRYLIPVLARTQEVQP